MKQHDLPQGSPEWHAHRAQHFNASDAPAMLGCSPYKTRTQLLQEKHTGYTPEVDASTQRRFDDGHRFEALARPLGETIVGEDLYPVVGSLGELSASFDGLTLLEDAGFEHKSLNDELRYTPWDEGNGCHLPKQYRVQMEQQLLVSGAERVLFMATKWTPSGELTEERHCWYASDPALRAEIVAGWKVFAADLAVYRPAEVKELPKAEVTLALPTLFIHAKGEITTSNMKEYGAALAARLADVRAIQLINDQDFSNAKESAKLLRENIQQAKLAKEAMLSQTVTVGEAARMIDAWCEDMRLTALKLEQDVEREDKVKKTAMIAQAKGAYDQHIQALIVDTGGPWIVLQAPDWASALKNKRSYTSMQDALDTMLANAKIAADDSARKIRAALACMTEEGKDYDFLLADRLALIGKPLDDLRTLIRARITQHQAAEAKRMEAEREKIRAEEAARLEREQQERLAREASEREAAEQRAANERYLEGAEERERQRQAEIAGAVLAVRAGNTILTPAAAPIAPPAPASQAAAPSVVQLQRPAVHASPPSLKLGQIGERLGFTLTADFLASLGFAPAATDKNSKLFHEADFSRICSALIAHIQRAQDLRAAA